MAAILQSIPCPMNTHDELEQMVLNDLLGPVGGAEENEKGVGSLLKMKKRSGVF
jgi:hypothetical protein